MGRYERKRYFDRLCEMRDAYGSSPDDTRGTISIDDAIVYAEAVMTALIEHDRETALQERALAAEAEACDTEPAINTDPAAERDPADLADSKPLGKFGPFGRFQGHPGRNRA
jgi:hypothetical protein